MKIKILDQKQSLVLVPIDEKNRYFFIVTISFPEKKSLNKALFFYLFLLSFQGVMNKDKAKPTLCNFCVF